MRVCEVSEYCGGCNYQKIEYQKQLAIKQKYIEEVLSGFGKIEPILGSKEPYNYRNKVQVTFGKLNNKVVVGNYVPNSHLIVPIKDCMIADQKANEIIESIRRLVIKYRISIFDEKVYKGCMRHVLVRSTSLNEYMVVLVTGSFNINKKEEFLNDLLKYNPEITTIIQNHNNKRTSMILGDKSVVLYGKGFVSDKLCGKTFQISPNSFYQINKTQTEILYNTAISLANFKGNETLIDAYCGTGTIGLCASNKVKSVIGVELNEKAIKDAINNAHINGIKNAFFVADDAGHFMEKVAKDKSQIDAVIMDPPRSGADIKFLKSLVYLFPKKIIYVSCGPESLASNLKYLTKNKYRIKKIQPVDMFPYTSHVETVVLLER